MNWWTNTLEGGATELILLIRSSSTFSGNNLPILFTREPWEALQQPISPTREGLCAIKTSR